MKTKAVLLVALASFTLLLSACASPGDVTPSPTPVKAPSPPAESTLDGGRVVGDGVSIEQISPKDASDHMRNGVMGRESDNSFIFEYGGSGSKDCLSNFTAIERVGEKFTLEHKIGNGEKGLMCTTDYSFTYFLVTADEPVSDDAVVTVNSDGKAERTFSFGNTVK